MSSSIELGIDQFSEANNVILMSLMEETHEYEDEYIGDDKLVSMIQSLEAEISDTQNYDMGGYMDGQDCSTSLIIDSDHWVDIELISSSLFDEVNMNVNANTWCENEMEHMKMEYEDQNFIDDFQMCYGVFMEQQHRKS
ncbi:uncharacterized protein LOC131598881 [Vicia villosa]|uniref:uncharacterized protein LOC131598881 n=1 Tax=Vicia villosa TaxID=3911 RepID=UPI00273C885E|nr:uncharacterized protein LOC131598881 [Vicia villosa]